MEEAWFKQNNINVLKWPAQSPDLNPIEHLWQHLKRQLNAYEVPPAGIHELWDRVQMEWEKIPKEVCRNMIESMPRRIEAVIKAKGAQTKYSETCLRVWGLLTTKTHTKRQGIPSDNR